MWNRFKTLDPWLFVLPLLLIPTSVAIIYTLTVGSVGNALAIRQGVYGLIGVVLLLVATFIDYRSLKTWAPWIYGAGMIGLLLVELLGREDFGAQRWIGIGPFQLQPAELEKLVIIISLAAFLSRSLLTLSWRRFLTILLLLAIPVLAVLVEPDLGTALVIFFTGIGMLFHARLSKWQKGSLIAFLVILVSIFILSFQGVAPFSSVLKDYQKDRLASFIEPQRDPGGSGYNVVQSVIAVGSGGLMGQGLGQASQSQLNFLPVAHADFIFASIAESWGLIGSWGIVGVFGFLLIRLINAARIAKDEFGMLLCIGVAIKILVEVLVNIGMNMRLMPVTGIPLPFLSYGGTTLITNALALGIVQSVVIRYKRLTF